jgi:predicted  nucleic acid-binding Zn-ribbon protein
MSNWWDGAEMIDNDFSPYDELQRIKLEQLQQRHTINNLVTSNNNLSDLMVELSKQHQRLTRDYANVMQELNDALKELKKQQSQ